MGIVGPTEIDGMLVPPGKATDSSLDHWITAQV